MDSEIGDAIASEEIIATRAEVWLALTDPKIIQKYFLGMDVRTDWSPGGPIVFQGEWNDRRYEDKGTVLDFVPGRLLRITHYSPLSGLPDLPENYHTVTYSVETAGDTTTVTITQSNNKSQNDVHESAKTWQLVLGNLKALLEN